MTYRHQQFGMVGVSESVSSSNGRTVVVVTPIVWFVALGHLFHVYGLQRTVHQAVYGGSELSAIMQRITA